MRRYAMDGGCQIDAREKSLTESKGAALPMLVIPVLVGVLVYLSTLTGGFLSDDYLISRFVTSDGGIRWDQALRDFGGPWGGFEGGLYRPLISLSLCFDTMVGGGSAASFHSTNLLFHAISIFCVSWLCGSYAKCRKGVLALLGGSLFALNPIGVEAVAWILGRVSSQEVALRLISLCCFTLWLQERRPGRYALAAVFAMAALLSKESAVILPLAFLGLDLLQGGRGRTLIMRQLLFVPIWLLYAALRFHALSSGGARSAGDVLAGFFPGLWGKVHILLLPGFDSPLLLWAVLVFFLLVLFRLGPVRWPWVPVALLLWCLQFLPSALVPVDAELSGSRILYGPLALSMVLLSACLGLPAGRYTYAQPGLSTQTRVNVLSRAIDALLIGLLFVSLPFLGKAAGRRITDYQRAWELVDGYRADLSAWARDSERERPIVLLSAPADRWGIPLLRADTMFSVFEPPFSSHETPMLSLIPVLRELPKQKELFHDALPLRRLWQRGSPLLLWDGKTLSVEKSPGKAQSLELERRSDKSFHFTKGPVTPFAIQGVELVVEGEATALTILLPTATGQVAWKSMALGEGLEEANGRVYRLDWSHDLLPLVARYHGGIAGYQLEGKGKILSMSLRPSFAVFADGLESNQEVRLDDGGRLSLKAPVLPKSVSSLRFYLIGPHGGLSMDVVPGQSIQLAPAKALVLRSVFKLSSLRDFYVFFEAIPKPGHWPLHTPGTIIRLTPR